MKTTPFEETRSLYEIVDSLRRQADRNWEKTTDEWIRVSSWSAREAYEQVLRIIEKNEQNRFFRVK